MKKWIIAGAVLAVLFGIAGGGYLLLVRTLGAAADDEAFLDESALRQGEAVEVEHGEISSVLVLDATVRAEPGEDVKARNGGSVTRVWVQDGERVDSGAPVVNLAVPDGSAAPADDEDGAGASTTAEVTLRAPDDGEVAGLDLEVGEDVEPGAVVATVAPDQYRAVAAVPPNDLYRFYDDPTEISLKIDQGPPAESCEFLSLGEDAAGGGEPDEEGGGDAGGGGDGSGVEFACRVSSSLDVFPGVQGQLSIVTGEAKNALIVPVTAVRGNFETGEVVLVNSDGSEEAREVELGVSDGTSIEVTDGLSVGDEVMDPVPLEEEFDVPDAYESDKDEEFIEEDF